MVTNKAGLAATYVSGEGQSGSSTWVNYKEIVTSLLAFGIAGVTLYMVVVTFLSAGDQNFNNHKDVLLYGLSMLGAVIGYYFGRVPAELHAQQATKQAEKAEAQAAFAQAETQRLSGVYKATLLGIKENLGEAGNPPKMTIRASVQSTGLAQALAEVDAALVDL